MGLLGKAYRCEKARVDPPADTIVDDLVMSGHSPCHRREYGESGDDAQDAKADDGLVAVVCVVCVGHVGCARGNCKGAIIQ